MAGSSWHRQKKKSGLTTPNIAKAMSSKPLRLGIARAIHAKSLGPSIEKVIKGKQPKGGISKAMWERPHSAVIAIPLHGGRCTRSLTNTRDFYTLSGFLPTVLLPMLFVPGRWFISHVKFVGC